MPIDVKGDTLIQILKEPSTIANTEKQLLGLSYLMLNTQGPGVTHTIQKFFTLDWPENDSTLYGDYLCYVFFNNHFVKFTNKNLQLEPSRHKRQRSTYFLFSTAGEQEICGCLPLTTSGL